LWVAPFLFASMLWLRRKPGEARLIIGVAGVAGAAVLLFLISTHLASHRYEADFVPLLVFAAVAGIAVTRSRVLTRAACVLLAYSAMANLALGLAGPYDDFLKNHPQRYVRLAGKFSPAAEYRPQLSPRIAVKLTAQFEPAGVGYREPLVTIGHSHYCYFLYSERLASGIRLVSKTNEAQISRDIAYSGGAPLSVGLTYSPETTDMTISADGRDVLTQRVGTLVAAPAQVAIGENLADMGLTARYFLGTITVSQKTVVQR
jgi:hypothetical protein